MEKLKKWFRSDKIITDFVIMAVILSIFTGVFVYWGNLKSVNFCDEIYTYILSNSRNEFLAFQLEGGRWYTGAETSSILAAVDGLQLGQVMLNNKGDVHPPMYYFVFHIISVLRPRSISKWIGLLANWMFGVVSLIALYSLIKRVTGKRELVIAACLVYISSPAIISSSMFLRMYAMFSMWVILFVYVTYRILQKDGIKKKWYLFAALCAITFFGFLTQYYFAVFCVLFTFFYCLYRLVKKQWKEIFAYVGSLCAAVVCATLFWKTWIKHMFSGYLGGAVVENAFNFGKVLNSIKYGFVHLFNLMYNRLGIVIGIILIVAVVAMIVKKDKRVLYVGTLMGTAVLYSIAVVHLTPGHLLSYRYFFPVVAIAYIAELLAVFFVAEDFLKEKYVYVGMAFCLVLSVLNFARPVYDKDAILYVDTKGTYRQNMQTLAENSDIPWVYYGYENATMTELFYDSYMADAFVMVNKDNPLVFNDYIEKNHEFILFMGQEDFFGENVYTNLESWIGEKLNYEFIMQKGNLSVYKVTWNIKGE
ncbi:MAG: glycosyltransferase family 39 protein [Lachnospiraceae bacterium]